MDRIAFSLLAPEKQPMDLLGGTLHQYSFVCLGDAGHSFDELVWLGVLFVRHRQFQTDPTNHTHSGVLQQDAENALHLRPSHRVGRQATDEKSPPRLAEEGV